MRNKAALLALLATSLTVPLAAQADPTSWIVQATIADVGQPPDFSFPSQIDVGNPITIVLGFDTSALLRPIVPNPTFDAGGGALYRYKPDSITMDLSAGSLGPIHIGFGGTGSFIVRDNYPDPAFADLVDGLSFGLTDTSDANGEFTIFSLLFRGPLLDLLDIPASGLPATPDPRLADLRLASFQVCRYRSTDADPSACSIGHFFADVNSVTAPVPEPGSYALMALGLAGMGLVARRRSNAQLARPGSAGAGGTAT